MSNQNLRVSITEAFNDTVPSGHVISQYPEAASVVKEQRLITLIVSRGGEATVVPDLRGLNRRDAELQLKNAGLRIGRVEEQFNSSIAADTVISQNPRPPAQISKNTAIDLVISKGEGPRKFALPDFTGTPLTTVGAQLESLKLKQGKVSEETSDKYPSGTIIGQNPLPAAEVTEGMTIDFTVSKGSNLLKRALVQITVPEGPAKQAVQIVVTDNGGRKVVYENIHKVGDKIEKTVDGSGQVRVQVYINGVLLQEQTL